jgi:hypothetical protein
MRVLQEAGILKGSHVVDQIREKGEIAYVKISPFTTNHKKVLSLAGNKEKLEKFPTKINSSSSRSQKTIIVAKYPQTLIRVKQIYIDQFDAFSKIKRIKTSLKVTPVDENKFKASVKKLIGETGEFTDWGGEKNDLYTTRTKLRGNRYSAVFAFKGKGKKGILKPNMMGKNGDQIPRLYQTVADIYVLQYWDQVDQSVYELMYNLAVSVSAIQQRKVFYCIVDGNDTARLIAAYPSYF